MMIETSTWNSRMVQHECINRFTPQDMNIRSPYESFNHDMMIGTSTRDSEFINQCTSQDINGRNQSSETNLPYITSQVESSNFDMMIGTSTSDNDLDLLTVDQLEFMNRFFMPQDFNARHDDEIK
ncbi:unnamed protein product [Lactuca saligna]|uniref:Uncharacterized protein n=1 Tax=Lactuca saligna TaxID=75948 RepID=A0AA36EAM8_LACSI|nr:unnamed protein product [Lactuca saligna]